LDQDNYRSWKPATGAMEPAQAEAVAAYLRANGIPARVEPASGGALMVTVPAWLESEAVFAAKYASVDASDATFVQGARSRPEPERGGVRSPDAFSRLSRAMMVVAALAFSPIAVALTVLIALANRLRSR
jgi:hypothetical protein